MGAAIGLTLEQVGPFLTSLANTDYHGAIVLFVDRRLERDLRSATIECRLTLIRASQWLPFKFKLLDRPRAMRLVWAPLQRSLWSVLRVLDRLPLSDTMRLRLQLPIALLHYSPMDARFLRYEQFLSQQAYDHVLLTDVRDVLFQSDPFDDLPREGLAVGIETASYTIATEWHNATWLARAYGANMLAQIGSRRVSCVGVTYGDAQAVTNYVRLFNRELLNLSPEGTGIGGADTAIHNMLLWTGRLGEVHRLEPLRSPVATLNGVDETSVRLNASGHVLNEDGSEPSVLHQYDRLPSLRDRLRRTLAS